MAIVDEVVISLHGVESQGAWQAKITPALSGIHGLIHEPHIYGRFRFWKVLIGPLRTREVNRLYKKLSDLRDKHPHVQPSVIAHSFGTYLVSRMLITHPEIRLNRVVLCGSIIERDYNWERLFAAEQVRKVRNELAGLDPVVALFRYRIMRFLIPHTGASGIDKFIRTIEGLEEHPFEQFSHSSHFVAEIHCRSHWVPFVRGTREFMELCQHCIDPGNPNRPDARREFTDLYYSAIVKAVKIAFPQRSNARVTDYAAVVRELVVNEGARGERSFGELVEIFTRALMQNVH
jgi:serine/threonine-protein kinase